MTNRIDETLAALRSEGKSALAPFVTLGYPDKATSEAMAESILESGADMLELGIPFSDPLADGPTVQMTSFRALENGTNLQMALESLQTLRTRGITSPLIFMGYLNPFLNYGIEKFAKDASDAGIDGIIIPDLPPEEAPPYQAILESQGIYLIPLLAPTSTDARIEQACKQARGFIYCVSVTGVTGARSELSGGVEGLARRIRKHSDLPILVGFGVSRQEHVENIARFADGAILASAMLDSVSKAPIEDAAETAARFIRRLRGEG
jgi:tryptophan synthase alpha chain